MPPFDDESPETQVLASLEVVDATLAGEPVDPADAELAELTLLLASERPAIDPRFADSLDRAVQRRFAPLPAERPPARVSRLRQRWWVWSPAAGLALALITAIVIVAGSGHPATTGAGGFGAAKAPASGSANSAPSSAAPPVSSGAPARRTSSSSATSAASGAAASAPPSAGGSSSPAPGPEPTPNGRKIVQSAQLSLTTAPGRIDQVAQEVFVVVGQVGGIVNSSQVTATNGPGGYAQFQLSIPSAGLPQAMAALSGLRYARVASRSDSTQDVNDQYAADVRALNDARALRTSLLKQLANATTQTQINSLTAQIHDAEASISSDEATLKRLNQQINYSQVGLTINGGIQPVVVASRGTGGFGVGQAAHDAGRVLAVAAGIALIAAAALVPLGLLAGLAWWIAAAVRRRRREQALDLV